MLMAKTKTNAIIVFDAFIFVELLHKSVWQHVVVVPTPATVRLLALQVAAHDETDVLKREVADVVTFY
jgi:hypothetical protein